MQYDNLKKKAVELLIGNAWPYGFTGQMPDDLKQLFIEMADEICCLKARVDELEKKMAKIHQENVSHMIYNPFLSENIETTMEEPHFEAETDNGETES